MTANLVHPFRPKLIKPTLIFSKNDYQELANDVPKFTNVHIGSKNIKGGPTSRNPPKLH